MWQVRIAAWFRRKLYFLSDFIYTENSKEIYCVNHRSISSLEVGKGKGVGGNEERAHRVTCSLLIRATFGEGMGLALFGTFLHFLFFSFFCRFLKVRHAACHQQVVPRNQFLDVGNVYAVPVERRQYFAQVGI